MIFSGEGGGAEIGLEANLCPPNGNQLQKGEVLNLGSKALLGVPGRVKKYSQGFGGTMPLPPHLWYWGHFCLPFSSYAFCNYKKDRNIPCESVSLGLISELLAAALPLSDDAEAYYALMHIHEV